MSLAPELAAYKEKSAEAAPAEVLAIFEDSITEVAESGIAETALNVGETAPDFTLADPTGKQVALADLLSNGPVIVNFYRGGWCPYCNLELRAFQALLPEIEAAGGTLVAISPQTPDGSLTTQEKAELDFTVLSDPGSKVGKRFGLVFTMGEAVKAVYTKAGRDLGEVNGTGTWELPIPATYVIGTDGVIAFASVDADYRNRAEPAEVVAALRAAS